MKEKAFITYYDISGLDLSKIVIEHNGVSRVIEMDEAHVKTPMKHLLYYVKNQGMHSFDEIKDSLYPEKRFVKDNTITQNRSRIIQDYPELSQCFVKNPVENGMGFYLKQDQDVTFSFYDENGLVEVPERKVHFDGSEFSEDAALKTDITDFTNDRENDNIIDLSRAFACHENGDPTVLEIVDQQKNQIHCAFTFDETSCVWAMICIQNLGCWKDKAFLSFGMNTCFDLKGVHIEMKGIRGPYPKAIPVKYTKPGRHRTKISLPQEVKSLDTVHELCFTFFRRTDAVKNGVGEFSIYDVKLEE